MTTNIFKKRKVLYTNRIIYLSSAVICALSFIFSIVTLNSMSKMSNIANRIYAHSYEVSNAEWTIRWSMSSINQYIAQIVNENDKSIIEEVESEIDTISVKLNEYYNIISDRYIGPDKEIFINKFNEAIVKEKEIIKTAKLGELEKAQDMYKSEFVPMISSLDSLLIKMIDFMLTRMIDIINESKVIYSFERIILIILSISISALTIFFAVVISKRRREDVSSREILFNMLTENIDDVYLMYNLKRRKMEFVSSNAERKFGVEYETIFNDTNALKDYMNNEDVNALREMYKTPQRKMTEWKTEIKNPRTLKNSYMHIRIYPVIKEGEITRYIINFTDITDILASQRDLKDALNSAENANNSKRDFLARMSHEIRTPINAIRGMTYIANSNLDDKNKMTDCLKKIEISSKFLLDIINDILDMSKIESGKMNIISEHFTLSSFISSIESIINPQAKLKEISFDIIFDGIENNNLIGDSLRLNQIIINILSNAIKFTPKGGKITLTIKEVKRKGKIRILFIIKDTGIGMDEEELSRIFKPFEQANMNTNIKHGGTGLGLSITKNLVELMNGSINVSSVKGEGTQFSIELPFEIDKEKTNNYPITDIAFDNLKKGDDEEDTYDFSGKRFLIVEDNELNLEIASEILKFKGANIETAENGKIALEKFEESAPRYYDAILMDVRMPILNGYEATKKIRKSNHLDSSNIPIIAMTANAFNEDVFKALECGMNAHIAKPIDKDVLYSTLNEFIR